MEYELFLDARDIKIIPANETQEILQNVLMILLTEKYSVPLDREFGIDGRIVDAPINQTSRITAAAAQAIRTYEPRARLKRVNFSGDATQGQVISSVIVEIVEKNLRGSLLRRSV